MALFPGLETEELVSLLKTVFNIPNNDTIVGVMAEVYLINNNNYNIINDRICYVETNKYIEGLVNHVSKLYNDVKIIKYLENNNYDKLLSENIVFINLINVSACNTLIECVIRNTPIIINRLEGVEEILGTDYPLFYDNLVEASEIITDINRLKKGYEYLVKLDKTNLKIETFLSNFENIIKLIN